MKNVAIVIVLDNDKRDNAEFRRQLEKIAQKAEIATDCVFCIAVKEMEAWLLGDENAIADTYPAVRKKYIKAYKQDAIGDTWEVLANAIYPGGLNGLQKKSKTSYSEIGKAKCEWADKIGKNLTLEQNRSPSFQYFLSSLQVRIEMSYI